MSKKILKVIATLLGTILVITLLALSGTYYYITFKLCLEHLRQ